MKRIFESKMTLRYGYFCSCLRGLFYLLVASCLMSLILRNSGTVHFHRIWEKPIVYNISEFDFEPNYDAFDASEIQTATHMRQFITFWSENPDYDVKPALHSENYSTKEKTIKVLGYDPLDDVPDYTYQVNTSQKQRSILVQVIEFLKGNFSTGGSSLRGLIQGEGILTTCSFQDYFNGTYILECPIYSKCTHLNITLHHFNFKQHQGVTKRLDINLMDQEICVPRNEHQDKPKAFWTEQLGLSQWKWFDQGVTYPMDNDGDFCKLVDAMTRDRFYMIGSSHMRYQHLYIMTTCLKHIGDLDKRLVYVFARFGDNVIQRLEEFTRPNKRWLKCPTKFPKYRTAINVDKFPANKINNTLGNLTKRHVSNLCPYDPDMRTGMMIQTGSWDLVYNGMRDSIQHLMPKLDTIFRRITRFQRRYAPSLRLLVMGPPTFHPSGVYAENRNNDHIQIFNHAFRTVSERHGLKYINVFDMMYPKFDRVTENNHYIACDFEQCHFEVGIVAIQLAVEALVRDGESPKIRADHTVI